MKRLVKCCIGIQCRDRNQANLGKGDNQSLEMVFLYPAHILDTTEANKAKF